MANNPGFEQEKISVTTEPETVLPADPYFNPSLNFSGNITSIRNHYVDLNISATNATEMYLTKNADCSSGGVWENYATTKTNWHLGDSLGQKVVYIKFKNAAGETSDCVFRSISLNQIAVTQASSSTLDGSYGATANIDLSIKFSDIVTVTGVPRIVLNVLPTTRYASYVSGSGTDTLTFSYVVSATDASQNLDWASTTSLELNSGTIVDSGNNSVSLVLPTPGGSGSLAASKNIVISTPYKLVFAVQPSNSEAGVNLSPSVKIQISDYFNTLIPGATDLVSLTLSTNPTAATLNGITSKNAVAGEATFADLNILNVGGYSITAAAAGLLSAVSSGFYITAAPVASLVFLSSSATSSPINFCSPMLALELRDAHGNAATPTSAITVNLSENGSGNELFYLVSDCSGASVTSVSISTGKTGAQFYFKNDSAEAVIVSAQDSLTTFPAATQNVTFTALGSSDTWYIGDSSFSMDRTTGHTAVWTGQEMIVWGGSTGGYPSVMTNRGFRYNPTTNTAYPTSITGAPVARSNHSAVWTGTEMIVWGGASGATLNSGGKYNPLQDNWTSTTTTNAPVTRQSHAAVWTGTEMIIWGGHSSNSYRNSGGRYNPLRNEWVLSSSTTNAPTSTLNSINFHWTGSKVISWSSTSTHLYDPNTNAWTLASTVGAPPLTTDGSSVWTGTELLVWGGTLTGGYSASGYRYNPSSNTWTSMNQTGAPSPRRNASAVWTGSEMVIWGGEGPSLVFSGAKYNPSSNSWSAITTTGAPALGYDYSTVPRVVWTGTEMIFWGGANTAVYEGKYNPSTDTWSSLGGSSQFPYSNLSKSVWTGTEFIAWGGETTTGSVGEGFRYNPTTNSVTPTTLTGAPSRRYAHASVWSGTEMLVWGGYSISATTNTGGRYNPATDSWTAMTTSGALSSRFWVEAAWGGGVMVIYGGSTAAGGYVGDAARYNPTTNTWSSVSSTGMPGARNVHSMTWTGSEVMVFGGSNNGTALNTGGLYDPVANTWRSFTATGVPSGRSGHSALWTGSHVIIWGGGASGTYFNTGGRYDPVGNTWNATTTTGAPAGRSSHAAVWTGSEMLIWGGTASGSAYHNSGGRYNPAMNTWTSMSTLNAPLGRAGPLTAWTGTYFLIWGGYGSNGVSKSLIKYVP